MPASQLRPRQLRPRALLACRPPAVCNSKQHRTDIVPLDVFGRLAAKMKIRSGLGTSTRLEGWEHHPLSKSSLA